MMSWFTSGAASASSALSAVEPPRAGKVLTAEDAEDAEVTLSRNNDYLPIRNEWKRPSQ
jgi:hypothetical protein